MDAVAETPLDALDRAGYRLTGPRRAVADLVAARSGHFTAAELIDEALRGDLGIARATVFRTLEALEAVGAIERLDLPTGEHAWIACEPSAHHHHVVCRRCGRAADADDAGLPAVVQRIATTTGYRVEGHRLELFGLCPACQADLAAD